MTKARLDEEHYLRIKEVMRETHSFKQTAAILGYKESTLRGLYWRKDWLKPPNKRMAKIDLCLTWDLRKQGQSYAKIARALGVNSKTLRMVMRREGLTCKKVDEPTPKAQEYYRMKKRGMTYAAIGEKFGVTRQAVEIALKYWYGKDVGMRFSQRKKNFNIAAMVELKRQGWNNIQVADLFETDPRYVTELLKNIWGEVPLTQRSRWDRYEAWSLFEQGWSYGKLANKFHVGVTTIIQGIKRVRKLSGA